MELLAVITVWVIIKDIYYFGITKRNKDIRFYFALILVSGYTYLLFYLALPIYETLIRTMTHIFGVQFKNIAYGVTTLPFIVDLISSYYIQRKEEELKEDSEIKEANILVMQMYHAIAFSAFSVLILSLVTIFFSVWSLYQ